MDFITLNGVHIRLAMVRSFSWHNGALHVHFAAENTTRSWRDPDKELYTKLCKALGQTPVE